MRVGKRSFDYKDKSAGVTVKKKIRTSVSALTEKEKAELTKIGKENAALIDAKLEKLGIKRNLGRSGYFQLDCPLTSENKNFVRSRLAEGIGGVKNNFKLIFNNKFLVFTKNFGIGDNLKYTISVKMFKEIVLKDKQLRFLFWNPEELAYSRGNIIQKKLIKRKILNFTKAIDAKLSDWDINTLRFIFNPKELIAGGFTASQIKEAFHGFKNFE